MEVPSLKARERRKVNNEVKIVNGVIHNVEVKTLSKVNKNVVCRVVCGSR